MSETTTATPTVDEPVKTKKKRKPPTGFDLNRWASLNKEVWQLRVDVLGEELAGNLSVEDGKRSPVELY